MRKLFLFVAIICVILVIYPHLPSMNVSNTEQADYQVIPDEAIRLRILANSDREEDQKIKRDVRDAVNEEVTKWVEDLTDIDQARTLIASRVDKLDAIVADVLQDQQLSTDYNVEYAKDVSFPTKLYGNYLYPAGEYEAILISLGEAKGANWWCVVFPPLCFLDFSFGTTVEDEEASEEEDVDKKEEKEDDDEDVEYAFFFLRWF
nr:stage II sporulation protein R [Gracilibacillus halophilus]